MPTAAPPIWVEILTLRDITYHRLGIFTTGKTIDLHKLPEKEEDELKTDFINLALSISMRLGLD